MLTRYQFEVVTEYVRFGMEVSCAHIIMFALNLNIYQHVSMVCVDIKSQ